MGRKISSSTKKDLLSHIRSIVDKKKSTVMVGIRPVLGEDDHYIVCLSPNLMKHIVKFPSHWDDFIISYQPLEPFTEYRKKYDGCF